jgi:membrane fusion protein, multidrug efflux system
VAVAGIGAAWYYLSMRNQETTDDAYTEGRAVAMAPKVPGYVVERLIDENKRVAAGDLLLRIDPRDYLAARDQAAASLRRGQYRQ